MKATEATSFSIAVWGCLGRLLVQDCLLAGAFAGFSFRFSRDASSIEKNLYCHILNRLMSPKQRDSNRSAIGRPPTTYTKEIKRLCMIWSYLVMQSWSVVQYLLDRSGLIPIQLPMRPQACQSSWAWDLKVGWKLYGGMVTIGDSSIIILIYLILSFKVLTDHRRIASQSKGKRKEPGKLEVRSSTKNHLKLWDLWSSTCCFAKSEMERHVLTGSTVCEPAVEHMTCLAIDPKVHSSDCTWKFRRQ